MYVKGGEGERASWNEVSENRKRGAEGLLFMEDVACVFKLQPTLRTSS